MARELPSKSTRKAPAEPRAKEPKKTVLKESIAEPVEVKPAQAAAPQEPEPQPASVVSSYRMPEREDAQFAERVSLKIAGGKIDFSSVRASSASRIKDALKATFQDEEARKWLGIEAVSAQELEEIFAPEQAGMILDTIVRIELIFATSTTKLPVEECEKFLCWSENEHKILDKQAARVIARYVPVEWLKRLDLWIFLLTWIGFTFMKFKKLTDHARLVTKAAEKAINEADKNPQSAAQPEPPSTAGTPAAPTNLMPSTEAIQ